jgi:hypothetical protein
MKRAADRYLELDSREFAKSDNWANPMDGGTGSKTVYTFFYYRRVQGIETKMSTLEAETRRVIAY